MTRRLTALLVVAGGVDSDEGHGFARPENSLDFFARAESFVADILGGRLAKMTADKIPGSTAVVKYVAAKPATAQR